jgi:hypothetical protein
VTIAFSFISERTAYGLGRNESGEQFSIKHNEELRDSYRSPNIVKTVKSMRLRWSSYDMRDTERIQNFDYETS